ncbi:MAG: hypothetical protein M9916_01570 [Crocinitomicaceae bacterium]|nr:hypothetical protein [Crocinitomicaceae bacterium]
MKFLLTLAILLCWSIGLASSIEINEAVKTGKIKVQTKYEQLGHKGVMLTISNLSSAALSITVPPGTTFKASDEEQELLNIEEQLIALNSKETKTVEVGGYCTQLSKIAPRLESKFNVGKTKNALLIAFLDFLKTNNPSKTNYQNAVWALTDRESISSIEVKNDADNKLREFIAKQTNRTNPWHTNVQNMNVVPGRPIERRTMAVSGHLDVTTTKDIPFHFVVVNDRGEEKQIINTNQTIEKNIKNTFRFALTVQGWEKGKYKINIQSKEDGSIIKAFDFEI